jgi:DNA repair exonuclease SbcCD ATPase subunit
MIRNFDISMLKVRNPKSKYLIAVGSTTFKSLLKEGYVYNEDANTLELPATSSPVDATPATKSRAPSVQEAPTTPDTIQPAPVLTQEEPVVTTKLNIPDTFVPKYIVHLSDIHIPINLHQQRQEEYNAVFQNLYTQLQTLPLEHTLIIITGDLVNTKLKTENETLVLAQSFLHKLSTLTHTVVIIGNHDFAENNTERLDSITAICHTMPQIHALKYTGVYTLPGLTLVFNSLFDQKFIKHRQLPPTDTPVYALYHGSLVGSKQDNGTTVVAHRHKFYPSITDFQGYNAVLLGHLHLRQFIKPHVAYAGSLIQQKFGEHPTEHGYILWDVMKHTGESVNIYNPYAFVILKANQGQLDGASQALIEALKDKKLRVRCDITDTNQLQLKSLTDTLRTTYTIDTLTHKDITAHAYTYPTAPSTEVNTIDTDLQLIKKMCKPQYTEAVSKLHTTYRKEETIHSTCISWRPLTMEFMNMFIYGNNHKNFINFAEGVTNICAPNTAGKSSIMNILLFALFDGVSFSSTSKTDILHKSSERGYVELTLVSNGTTYVIRKDIAQTKTQATYKTTLHKLDGARKISLNGTTQTSTVKDIQNIVGTREQFLNNNMICTRLAGTSILGMTPGDLAKHFYAVFNLSHYEDYLTKAKAAHKLIKQQITKLTTLQQHTKEKLAKINIHDVQQRLQELEQQEATIAEVISQLRASKDTVLADKATTTLLMQQLQLTTMDDVQDLATLQGQLRTLQESLDTFTAEVQEQAQTLPLKHIQAQIATIATQIASVPDIAPLQYKLQQLQDKIQEQQKSLTTTDTKDTLLLTLGQQQSQLQTIVESLRKYEKLQKPTQTYKDVPDKANTEQQLRSLHATRDRLLQLCSGYNQDDVPELQTVVAELQTEDTAESLTHKHAQLQVVVEQTENTLRTLRGNIHEPPAVQKDEILAVPDKYHVNHQELTQLQSQLDQIKSRQEPQTINIHTFNGQQWVLYQDHLDHAKDAYFQSLVKQRDDILHKIKHNREVDQIVAENNRVSARRTWMQRVAAMAELENISRRLDALEIKPVLQALTELDKINTDIQALTDIINYANYLEAQQLQEAAATLRINITQTREALDLIQLIQAGEEQLCQLKLQIEKAQHDRLNNNRLQGDLQHWQKINCAAELLQQIESVKAIISSWDKLQQHRKLQGRLADQDEQLQKLFFDIGEKEIAHATVKKGITELRVLCEEHGSLHTDEQAKIEELQGLTHEDEAFTEYERLMNRNGIPAAILEEQLVTFSATVNHIFHRYTKKYTFHCTLDKKEESGIQKIRLNIDTLDGLPLDHTRLSGFESVLLNISINKALHDMDRNFKAGIFVIDESLDCIDQEQFLLCLPDIFEILRSIFATVIVISHRDIPRQLVDNNLSIHKFGTYSVVD